MNGDRTIAALEAPSSQVIETFVQAFQDDPALSWIMPDPNKRRRALPRFFAVMAEQSHRLGTVLASGSHNAAALLYPSGTVKDGGLWDSLRLLAIFKGDLPRGLKVAEAMHARHPHPQPHTCLRYLAVAPEAQGKGWGGVVVRDTIARAAAKGEGVLLETAKESNVAIYARLGFEISEEWTVPGGGPKFWTMIHPAP